MTEGDIKARYQEAFRLYEQGRYDEAVTLCTALMESHPGEPDPMFLAGVIFRDHNQLEKALGLLHRAIVLSSENATYVLNLGIAYQMGNMMHEARACYLRVLDLVHGQADACNNLGKLYLDSGAQKEALEWFEKCVSHSPGYYQAFFNMGVAWQQMNSPRQAVQSYRRCLEICPEYADALNNLGIVLHQTRNFEDAVKTYERLLALKPDDPGAANNLGLVYRDMGRVEKAVPLFGRVVDLHPENLEALSNYVDQTGYACMWEDRDRARDRLREKTIAAMAEGKDPGITPFAAFKLGDDPGYNLDIARVYAGKVLSFVRGGSPFFPEPGAGDSQIKPGGHRIRVGYVSDDFKDHAMGHILHRLFPCHDRSRFEVTCYDYTDLGKTDYFAREIRKGCERHVDISGLDDEMSARAIFNDNIDILVDLKGYTHSNRIGIFARRPAPLQVSYLGFLGTTGARFMDYMVADPVVIPREEEQFYSEQIISLPVYQAADYTVLSPEKKTVRADWGLPEAAFVFCSFNQPYKFDAGLFDLWMGLLKKVPGSVLWLRRTSDLAAESLGKAALAAGVAPDRLVFAPKVPLADHLARLSLADLALDTRGYNGGATTSNALWAGVPVVSVPGRQLVARMSAASLSCLGMEDLVAPDLRVYEAICMRLATDSDYFASVRQALLDRRRTALVFDMKKFAGFLEEAYEGIWERYCSGGPPQSIQIQ
jgi:protein O-GlcNAc transferase